MADLTDTNIYGNITVNRKAYIKDYMLVEGDPDTTVATKGWVMTLPGPVGVQGSAGVQGSQGAVGYRGSAGVQGSQGAVGYRGSAGVQGSQGAVGYRGSAGVRGPTGAIGPSPFAAVYFNNVTIASPVDVISITAGASPSFTFNSATDTLLAFENYVYLLRYGIDYTISGSSIVTTGAYFKAAQYNFVVFKNATVAAASGQSDINNHIASTAAHGATAGATANSIARRDASGELWATKVHNAVWNDIADFVSIYEYIDIEYGKVYTRDEDQYVMWFNEKKGIYEKKGKVRIANSSDTCVLGIASDTYGFGLGENIQNMQIPIAIGGWVLAHVKEVYPFGTPLTFGEDGILTEASDTTKSYNIIATFDRIEKEEFWNGIEVNGRHWVHIL